LRSDWAVVGHFGRRGVLHKLAVTLSVGELTALFALLGTFELIDNLTAAKEKQTLALINIVQGRSGKISVQQWRSTGKIYNQLQQLYHQ
jgi:hypothetical protein